jgi:hypothetical protein
MWLDTKTDLHSQCDFDLISSPVLRLQWEEWEVCVTWPPACEDVFPETEERPLLEAATKQRSEDYSVCDIDL